MSRRPVAPPPKQRSGAARTVILVAIAAVLAGLIIGRGLSNNSSSGAKVTTPGGTTTKTTKAGAKGGATTVGSTVAPTTTTPAINLGAFKAVVLNGNGIKGTAAARTTELNALGVQVVKAADSTPKVDVSVFYAVDSASEPAARLLALKTGITYGGGYPTATPPAPIDQLGGATIVLLLGKDVANKVITDSGAAAAPAATATTAAPTATATTAKP